MTVKRLLLAVLVLSLCACGGGHKSQSTTATRNTAGEVTPAPIASSAGSMQAPAPAPSMDCGGSAPVWANENSHVYHVAGDPYYGKTKHGKYMCERDAAHEGYHLSKK